MNSGGDLVAQENRTMGKKISTIIIGQPLPMVSFLVKRYKDLVTT